MADGNLLEQWFIALTNRLFRRGDASRDDLKQRSPYTPPPTTERAAPTGGPTTPTPNAPVTSNATLNALAISMPSTAPHDPYSSSLERNLLRRAALVLRLRRFQMLSVSPLQSMLP